MDDPSLGDLNVGFQDQTEALRWVQKNIDSFGGNPNQVTINGQSAGGSSIELHLVAPQQEGLFQGGIAQSVYRTPLPTPQQQEVTVPVINSYLRGANNIISVAAVQLLCGKGWLRFELGQGDHGLPTQCQCERTRACTRCAIVSKFADFSSHETAYSRVFFSNGSFNSFHPVLDGKIISERPTPAILTGNIHRVPLIVGYALRFS